MALKLLVASPCSEKWESMTGDERVRHCAKCRMNVFNVKQLTEAEVVAMLRAKTGRVCGRIFQRRDGTVLTRDCPEGLARVRRQVVLAATAVLALLLGALAWRSRSPACATDLAAPTLAGRLRAKAEALEASLRATRTLGPLIEWIDPRPVALAGEIALPPPPAPSP
ncbi:MAG: hypothetical protein IT380_14310 [Myxococcales bacterium]|nr:hypothetical protein [Myxococcales bacterium]